jgi:GGDEF domain-containing protein
VRFSQEMLQLPDKFAMPETAIAPETIWKEVLLLVLGAAVDHMVHCSGSEGGDLDTFRKLAKASLTTLEESSDPKQVLLTAGALSQAVTKYLNDTQRRIHALASTGVAVPPVATTAITVDPCTGLAVRAEGEASIQRAIQRQVRSYAAVFYLHRMAMTNARFGEALGNQMILFCSQHISSRLTQKGDLLFRWSGPAFVAILERQDPHLGVSNEVQRMISVPLSRSIETPSRSVYLPMKVTADVFPLFKATDEEVIQKIEHFIFTASGQPSE